MTTVKVESLGLEYVKNWEIIEGFVKYKASNPEENEKIIQTCYDNWCYGCEKCEHRTLYDRINGVYRDQIEQMERLTHILVRLPGKSNTWYYFMMFCDKDSETKKMTVRRYFWVNDNPYRFDRRKGDIISMKDY